MMRADVIALLAAALAATACGDREPPPPPSTAVMPPPTDSVPQTVNTLRGDSIMARDTARVPQ